MVIKNPIKVVKSARRKRCGYETAGTTQADVALVSC